jgi:uncharacterized membrane protein YgcG
MRPASRRSGVLVALLSVLATFGLSAVAHAADSTPGGEALYWNDQFDSGPRTFSPGEYIQAGGQIAFRNDCSADGINDQVDRAAKIYIVPAGASVGQKLTDVGNAPNVAQTTLAGGYFDPDLIGYAGVGVPAGTYDVVFDECEDGTLDDKDAIFRDYITVEAPANGQVPSISPGIAKIKADAQAQADGWRNSLVAWTTLNTLLDIKERIECVMDVIECFVGPDALLGYFQSQVQSALGVDDPKDIATHSLTNAFGHYQGIANDPPDAGFAQATALDGVPLLPAGRPGDPTAAAGLDMIRAAQQEDVLSQALLHAMERYQGAESQNDPQWALAQARAAKLYASQLSDAITTTDGQLQTYKNALDGDARNGELDALLAGLRQLHDQVKAGGLTAEQTAGLKNAGLTDAQIQALTSKLAADDGLDRSRQSLVDAIGSQIAIGAAAQAKYVTMATDVDQLAIGPLTTTAPPYAPPANQIDGGITADAGGPYSGVQGTVLHLDASHTADPDAQATPLFAWDTDGDGQFDDATGATPSVTYDHPFDGRIGVKVTRAPDNDKVNTAIQAVAYATVHIAATNHPPTLGAATPDAFTVFARRGQDLGFSLAGSDPDAGQVTTTAWSVDGGPFTDLAGAFHHAFGAGDALGLHYVTARVRDDSGQGNGATSRTWSVVVQDADSDGDNWADNADCAPSDPAVHPGAAEVPGNGKDDDCDPSTADVAGGGGGGGGDNGGGGGSNGGGGGTSSGGGAPGTTGGQGASTTPGAATSTTKPATSADPCAGKKGTALKACQADQALKKALASCAKLKGKKKSTCVRKARALRKCATLTGKKATTCKAKARRIH